MHFTYLKSISTKYSTWYQYNQVYNPTFVEGGGGKRM